MHLELRPTGDGAAGEALDAGLQAVPRVHDRRRLGREGRLRQGGRL